MKCLQNFSCFKFQAFIFQEISFDRSFSTDTCQQDFSSTFLQNFSPPLQKHNEYRTLAEHDRQPDIAFNNNTINIYITTLQATSQPGRPDLFRMSSPLHVPDRPGRCYRSNGLFVCPGYRTRISLWPPDGTNQPPPLSPPNSHGVLCLWSMRFQSTSSGRLLKFFVPRRRDRRQNQLWNCILKRQLRPS